MREHECVCVCVLSSIHRPICQQKQSSASSHTKNWLSIPLIGLSVFCHLSIEICRRGSQSSMIRWPAVCSQTLCEPHRIMLVGLISPRANHFRHKGRIKPEIFFLIPWDFTLHFYSEHYLGLAGLLHFCHRFLYCLVASSTLICFFPSSITHSSSPTNLSSPP